MRASTTVLCLSAGLVAIGCVALALAPRTTPDGLGSAGPAREGPAADADLKDRVAGDEIGRPNTRDAERPSVEGNAGTVAAVPHRVTGDRGLERVAPRPPLSSLGRAATPPPPAAPQAYARGQAADKPDFSRLFRPVAPAAGRIEADGHDIHIAGVSPLSPDRVCDAADGATWPCGMQARTAFRLWLRGRAVDCKLPDKAGDEGQMTTRCTLDGDDVGRWLVENGWAAATAEGPYAGIEKQAREEGLGIFGKGPGGP